MPTLVLTAAQRLLSAANDHRAESLRLKAAGLYWLAATETVAAARCELEVRNRIGTIDITDADIALINRYGIKGV